MMLLDGSFDVSFFFVCPSSRNLPRRSSTILLSLEDVTTIPTTNKTAINPSPISNMVIKDIHHLPVLS
jgi:hypothetical protein